MTTRKLAKWLWITFVFVAPLICFSAPISGGGFEARMNGLADQLINVILPILAILGLIWAAILAVSGNETARSKMILVLMGSGVAFLAPYIIGWIKGVLN